MTANISGVRFDQIYGDNSGGAEFDTDGDGTATQEDEFVSFRNDTGDTIDISGWQIWSESAGTGAPDTAQSGLFHTFPPGTTLGAGDRLYVINEITGTPPAWAQEASEGGVESGAGGTSTNFLSEGDPNSTPEGVALVNPDTGEYIIFNMSPNASGIPSQSGFPGTHKVGEVDGNSVQNDQNAGSSYQYNASTGQYEYSNVFTPCFVAGTKVETANGHVPVEHLKAGDLIRTKDHGFQPLLWVAKRVIDLTAAKNDHLRPIYLGRLGVSPQHRMLLANDVLAPAKGLLHLADVDRDTTAQFVVYFHLLLPRHEVIFAEGRATESLLLGDTFLASTRMSDRIAISQIDIDPPRPCRRCLTVQEARALTHADGALHPAL